MLLPSSKENLHWQKYYQIYFTSSSNILTTGLAIADSFEKTALLLDCCFREGVIKVRLGSLERDYSLFRGVIPHLVNHFFGVKLMARV